ncbi:sulfotransferase [Lamprobacter modestohalophilus]|uniref:sulfotransferase n=1 Tax=Lamprobacter modestohalophilus TaxID=1064514 RepID=UPI002ADEB7B6|nr:sulfotransferase [Lamprobacter modestohalophilus]MEA1050960.1 sulfotransferase [Lamprobacter modestohalophilus]
MQVIYLAGFPRSGTTWVANLINTHDQVIYRHELLGRCNSALFGNTLFNALKTQHGLTNSEYHQLSKLIKRADITTDRPPFFQKRFGWYFHPKLHHLAWLANQAIPSLAPLYRRIYTLNDNSQAHYLMKETRSLKDAESVLQGLRVENLVFLIRRPEAVIASYLSGIEKGMMPNPNQSHKARWLRENQNSEQISELLSTISRADDLPNIEFLSLNWVVYHEIVLRLIKKYSGVAIILLYEDLLADTVGYCRELFKRLGLSPCLMVDEFVKPSHSSAFDKKRLLSRDAKNSYFSVYRDATFQANQWQEKLQESEAERIEHLTATMYQKLCLKAMRL